VVKINNPSVLITLLQSNKARLHSNPPKRSEMLSKFLETFSRQVQVASPLHSKESKGRKLLRKNKEPKDKQ